MEPKFKIGDVVRLNSGGNPWTVLRVYGGNNGHSYASLLRDDGQSLKQNQDIPVEALTLVEE